MLPPARGRNRALMSPLKQVSRDSSVLPTEVQGFSGSQGRGEEGVPAPCSSPLVLERAAGQQGSRVWAAQVSEA